MKYLIDKQDIIDGFYNLVGYYNMHDSNKTEVWYKQSDIIDMIEKLIPSAVKISSFIIEVKKVEDNNET